MAVAGVLMLGSLGLAISAGVTSDEPREQDTVRFDDSAFDSKLNILDLDGDDLPDVQENKILSTDRLQTDSDQDGMPDAWEGFFGLNPNDPADLAYDPDRDGLTNGEEYDESVKFLSERGFGKLFDPAKGLDPLNRDTDGDDLPDGWEVEFGLDPLQASGNSEDLDADGLTNLEEFHAGSNPKKFDTDGDGLHDGREVREYGTDPNKEDTDDDGMPDWWEVENKLSPTNPNDRFSDPDNDGLTNLLEFKHGASPLVEDTDGDGIPDGWEVKFGLDPSQFADGLTDLDADGLSNAGEYRFKDSLYQQSTDPKVADTDDDGLLDGEEARFGTNPFNGDTDLDLLSDGDEIHIYGTNPLTKDTDGDGLSDGKEIFETFTKPTVFDSDSDGLDDGREWAYWLDRMDRGRTQLEQSGTVPSLIANKFPGAPIDVQVKQMGPHGDPDLDGLLNILDEDSDSDQLFDGVEVNPPANFACAGEGTDPVDPDTDLDRIPDGWEASHGMDPCDPSDADDDPDHDGVAIYGKMDENGDIVARIRVSPMGPTPENPGSAGRELPEGYIHYLAEESFRFTNYYEYLNSTNPQVPDTDCDVTPDGWEALFSRPDAITGLPVPNPTEFDSELDMDRDGYDHQGSDGGKRDGKILESELFTNLEEWYYFTDPWENNTDAPLPADSDWEKITFLQDGAEVYLDQSNRSVADPTVGLDDNGVALITANRFTQVFTGPMTGCNMDYKGIPFPLKEGVAPVAMVPQLDPPMPPMGPMVIFAMIAVAVAVARPDRMVRPAIAEL